MRAGREVGSCDSKGLLVLLHLAGHKAPLPRGPSVVSEGAKLMTIRVKLHSDRGDRSAKTPRREEAWHVSGIGKKGKPVWVGCSESG